jgi:hypothetical protein
MPRVARLGVAERRALDNIIELLFTAVHTLATALPDVNS